MEDLLGMVEALLHLPVLVAMPGQGVAIHEHDSLNLCGSWLLPNACFHCYYLPTLVKMACSFICVAFSSLLASHSTPPLAT
jgi:hypothetical protein